MFAEVDNSCYLFGSFATDVVDKILLTPII